RRLDVFDLDFQFPIFFGNIFLSSFLPPFPLVFSILVLFISFHQCLRVCPLSAPLDPRVPLIASRSGQPAASVLPSASRAVVCVLAPDWLSFRTSLLFREKLPLVRRAGAVRLPRVACRLLSLLLLPRLSCVHLARVSSPRVVFSFVLSYPSPSLEMSNIILVQHFSGYPNDDPATVSRICLQCIPYCYAFPNWTAITPSFVQFDAMVPSSLLECNWFYRFDFEGFELPEDLQSDAEESSSSSSDESDSALDESPSLSDSDSDCSASSRWMLEPSVQKFPVDNQ
ncbi:Regulatory protein MIG2, partial [Frankliniella fusca]